MANIIKDFCKKFGYISLLYIKDGCYKFNNNTTIFIKDGTLHRSDGPAFISFSKGVYREQYYIYNINRFSEFNKEVICNIICDYSNGWNIWFYFIRSKPFRKECL